MLTKVGTWKSHFLLQCTESMVTFKPLRTREKLCKMVIDIIIPINAFLDLY